MNKRVLLIVGGGIAAYKSLDLVRRLADVNIDCRVVMTSAAQQFVTPLSFAALSGEQVFTDLFDLKDEAEMGHIQLSRDADLVLVCPATADLLARMATGQCNDLATTLLLASDKPIVVAPSMNVMMWQHAATQSNIQVLQARGVGFIGPADGDLACGEVGSGRLSEVADIVAAVQAVLDPGSKPLAGKHALVTSGPTHEPIDPVRYIANRSSGKQGHAIAAALAAAGARVTLVSGPVCIPAPTGVELVTVQSARDMLAAVQGALPADIAVCAAAVADWRPAEAGVQKLKKEAGQSTPTLRTVENPDILKTISQVGGNRPGLVIGFAAETQSVVAHASAKRLRKGCDWILANDVSPGSGTFGGDSNRVTVIDEVAADAWPTLSKQAVAERLVDRIVTHLQQG